MLNNELFFTKLIGDINMNIIFAFENFDSLAQLVGDIISGESVDGSMGSSAERTRRGKKLRMP